MRDTARIERILVLLGQVWRRYPDWRLGQAIDGIAPAGADPFYVEDDEWERLLRDELRRPPGELSDEEFEAEEATWD